MEMQLPKIRVTPETLATILNLMKSGELQIPKFQRDFVWPISKTRSLLDSLYKEFPIGTFFLWKAPIGIPPLTRISKEIMLGEPPPGVTSSYILDGQQRLTSLWCVVNGVKLGNTDYGRVCIDLEVATKHDSTDEEDFNEDIFVYRQSDNRRYVSVRELFGASALRIIDGILPEWKPAFHKAFNLFQTYPFSVVWVQEQSLADAIAIFQRINQGGKPLSRYDLVCANLWREDFDFRARVEQENNSLKSSGFGWVNETVFPQTFSLAIKDQCTTLDELSLTTDEVASRWNNVVRAIRLAIEFLVSNLGVIKYDFLPYNGQLAVLAYYFYKRGSGAIKQTERQFLWDWFWRVALSERYSSTSPTKMAEDAKKLLLLASGKAANFNYPVALTIENILRTKMGSTSSALRNSVLCLLALKRPRNFKDGSVINLHDIFYSNLKKAERHHIFPVGYLKRLGVPANQVHLLPNFCFIPADLNREVTDKAPFEYFEEYKSEVKDLSQILKTHLIPSDASSPIWDKDPSAFDRFLRNRAEILFKELNALLGDDAANAFPASEVVIGNDDVTSVEIRLRDFIHQIMEATSGELYWNQYLPQDVISLVQVRIKDQLERHPGISEQDFSSNRRKLDFCDVSDYEKIILKNWNVFSSYFMKKAQVSSHLSSYRNLRNSLLHSRKPSKQEQLDGQAALIWLEGVFQRTEVSLRAIDDEL